VSRTFEGKPYPIGSCITNRGVNFSVAAPFAERVEVLLYGNQKDLEPYEVISMIKGNKSGDYWHIEISGLVLGTIYCFRVFNKKESSCKYHQKVLLDPASREITGWDNYRKEKAIGIKSNIESCLKGVVTEREEFDFIRHPRPTHSWLKSIIYELHVGGFTKSSSDINSSIKGTFIGLIEKIPYFKSLGVTTLELLPIFVFDKNDAPIGKENFWGYSPINWFSPHNDYICSNSKFSPRDQVRKFVEACHDNDLEVIIDVVYNHTAEGDENGPTLSWRGFGEDIYYHLNNTGRYQDVTGCGNTIAANNPLTRHLIIESMRCWAREIGIDGFRFDLGISLSRGKGLKPLDYPPLFEEIESDPILSGLKLISEPWDCGGLYKLSDFPASKIRTWNGHFRDDLRRFWKGDRNSTWNLKDRLSGNKDLYKTENAKEFSINFITSHDGFTLLDLLSFSNKNNLANGENNRDGDNHNNSWNNGIDGPTTNKSIKDIRKRQQRNLLASLILTQGIPMILMGDEVGRSQGGNNNTWCQNNSLGWMLWDSQKIDNDLFNFVKKLIKLRQNIPELYMQNYKKNDSKNSLSEEFENLTIKWHGIKLGKPDWSSWSHTISYSIEKDNNEALIWIGLNAYSKNMIFELPKANTGWGKIIDTSITGNQGSDQSGIHSLPKIEIKNSSLVVLIKRELMLTRLN
tara:strand:- start:737 stop:2797 length:2061 start_codon:yes stop_codon:yes gene_type:complete